MLFPSEDAIKLRLITCSNMPADLEVVHVDWSFAYDGISVVCRSETFEEVEARLGTIPDLPSLDLIFHQEYLDAAGVAARMESVRFRRKTLGELAKVGLSS